MKKMSINEISLNYIDQNPERENTLIFLHGNSHSLKTFKKQMNSPVINDFRLIFVDLPGHGDSSTSKSYSVKFLAQILAEFISNLEIKKFILVGHSMGGHVALNILTTNSLPSGIFLFGTPPLKNPFDVDAFRGNPGGKAISMTHPNDEEILTLMDQMHYHGQEKRDAVEDFLNTDPNFRVDVLGDIASGKNEDEIELIKSFELPCLFLLATHESLVNNSYITRELSGIKNVQIEQIESGHSPQVENEIDFNKTLSEFSKQVFNEINFTDKYNGHKHERSQNEQRN